MKAKPKSKPELPKAKSAPGKSRTAKSPSSEKSELLTNYGKDAETIRKEVMRAKEKLKKKRPHLFEKLGDNDLLKSKED